MRDEHRPPGVNGRWSPARLAITGLAALALAAGCGAAPSPRAEGHPSVRLDAARAGGPPAGSRAQARRLARRLLGRVVLPRGSRPRPRHPLPPGLRRPADGGLAVDAVDIYRVVELPMPMRAAERFLAAHTPPGMTLSATGSEGDRHGTTERNVADMLRKPPRGIASAQVVDGIVRGPDGRSLVRVDAQVSWYPARSAAEYLDPGQYQAAEVTATIYGQRHVRKVGRTFTSAAIIDRMARLLDSLPASPGGATTCPNITVTYRLRFTPVGSAPPYVVQRDGCTSDGVTVGGQAQPALADYGKLGALLGRLLHVRGFSGRPAGGVRGPG